MNTEPLTDGETDALASALADDTVKSLERYSALASKWAKLTPRQLASQVFHEAVQLRAALVAQRFVRQRLSVMLKAEQEAHAHTRAHLETVLGDASGRRLLQLQLDRLRAAVRTYAVQQAGSADAASEAIVTVQDLLEHTKAQDDV